MPLTAEQETRLLELRQMKAEATGVKSDEKSKEGLLGRVGDALAEEWKGREYPKGQTSYDNFGTTGALPLAVMGGPRGMISAPEGAISSLSSGSKLSASERAAEVGKGLVDTAKEAWPYVKKGAAVAGGLAIGKGLIHKLGQ